MAVTGEPLVRPSRAAAARKPPRPRENSLGLRTDNAVQIAKQIKSGLPYRAFARLHKRSQLSLEAIAQVVRIPRRTLARRKARGKLTGLESERLLRLALGMQPLLELVEHQQDFLPRRKGVSPA